MQKENNSKYDILNTRQCKDLISTWVNPNLCDHVKIVITSNLWGRKGNRIKLKDWKYVLDIFKAYILGEQWSKLVF